MKKQIVFFLSCFLVFLCESTYCQEKVYTSLEQALQNKDSVLYLNLKNQRIHRFPMEILQLKNLQKLSMSRNYLDTIPKEIAELKHLHYLDLSSNFIEQLPKEISTLPLDTLILWDNHIHGFDSSFALLPLKYLDLRAILMSRKEQKAILKLFPNARVRKDHPCNCGS
jgi:Leucine-rich repeat (LRR) protein